MCTPKSPGPRTCRLDPPQSEGECRHQLKTLSSPACTTNPVRPNSFHSFSRSQVLCHINTALTPSCPPSMSSKSSHSSLPCKKQTWFYPSESRGAGIHTHTVYSLAWQSSQKLVMCLGGLSLILDFQGDYMTWEKTHPFAPNFFLHREPHHI